MFALKEKCPAADGGLYKIIGERVGARKRTRTSTTVRPLAPEASASANSAIRAQGNTTGRSYFGDGKGSFSRKGCCQWSQFGKVQGHQGINNTIAQRP